MRAEPRPEEVNGEPVRRPARPAAGPADDLYRYVPVPPACCDADGYLVEDGMSQNDDHLSETTLWYHALKRRLPMATVCSDLTLHYREGDRHRMIVPDLFVALRTPPLRGNRTSYKLWQYPVPDLVIELLSGGNSDHDVGPKRGTYEHLGVREYWLFDPAGHELATPLAGYRLRDGRYQEIRADAAGRLRSRVLGLDLHVRDGKLRFRDRATGEDLDTYDEAVDGRVAERNRAEAAERAQVAAERAQAAAERRAEAAERKLARLRTRHEGL